MAVAYPLKGNPEPRHLIEAANDLNDRVEELEGAPGGGAGELSELSDVADDLAATNGHFFVADGTDWSNRALLEADIPATIATNQEVTDAIATHAGAADPHTGYQKESEKGAASGYASLDGSTKVPIAQVPTGTTGTTVSLGNHNHDAAYEAAGAVAAHAGAADPHTGYQKESEKGAANGYASLNGSTKIPIAEIPTGTTSSTVSLGDHSHAAGNTLYAPGSVTVATGNFQLHANFLSLGAAENLTVEGTGAFIIV